MAESEFTVHEVEYLSVSTARTQNNRIVVITIRPDKGGFRPHNLALVRLAVERLLEELKTLLSRSAVCLVLLGAVGLGGCCI